MTKQFWKLLQADLKDLTATDALSLENFDPPFLQTLLEQDSPFAILMQSWSALPSLQPPFTALIANLLQRYEDRSQQSLPLAPVVSLIGQAVYLDRLCLALKLPNFQTWLQQIEQAPAPINLQQQFQVLTGLNLEGQDARQAIISFSTSRLAAVLNRLTAARLISLGMPSATAAQVVEQIAQQVEPEMLAALETVGGTIQPWVLWYGEENHAQLERHLRLDAYQETYIAPRPAELVFNESFSLQDIYVPLKAQPLTRQGEPDLDHPLIDLEHWIKTQLEANDDADQVILIQGGFGRGKTTFCRMFADWVRQHHYPHWTPILIPLQEVPSDITDFEAFLTQAVPPHLTQDDPDWLCHGDTHFLFLLDGFSELHLDDQASSLEQFFQQVGKFQESWAGHPTMGHRVIVTGRSLMIQTLERLLPPNLLRVELLPLDNALQDRWLTQWERLTGVNISSLRMMLAEPDLPERSLELTREPLMLYFLAAMHRDGELQLDMLQGTSAARAKFLLYQQIFYWALTKQRPGLLQRELSGAETESLRRLLAEAGLLAVQTKSDAVSITDLQQRLRHDEGVQTLLIEIQAKLREHSLTSALVTIYNQSDADRSGFIRFTHNSFGKLFFSRRLHETIEGWATQLTRRQTPEPLVPTETLHWEVYDLLGYGGLTPEMTEYLMVLLNANPEFDLAYLFKRLEDFYLRWCGGEFIDAPPENFAQKEMRLLGQQTKPGMVEPAMRLGQRQVDVYAGLNIMILLLELHGYARSHHEVSDTVAFYPCGRQGMPDFAPERLLRVIGYSHCVSPRAFRAIVGPYLSGVNLSGVSLVGVNLSGVNLSGADLRSADLSGADLRGANLSRANLVGASLDGTDLSNADLRGANLIGAYLRGADLSSAALSGADLSSANLIGASLSRADLQDADLSGAYLRGASLQSAILSRAYLIGASLSGACLSDAYLEQVDLSDANLHGADLSNVNLRHADLSGADLIGAYLSGASLCGASLCNANLNSADLIDADLCGADLSSANLVGADLSDLTLGEVKWSDRTKWQDVRGLEAAISVPEALKQQLGLLPQASGEPEPSV